MSGTHIDSLIIEGVSKGVTRELRPAGGGASRGSQGEQLCRQRRPPGKKERWGV